MDYSLATAYENAAPQLEICLRITPSSGWGEDAGAEEAQAPKPGPDPDDSVGGYEMYMAADDDEDEDEHGHDAGVAPEAAATYTGAGQRRKTKADPAVYKSSAEDEDDGVLFTMPAGWNSLSVVLRDRGVLRFVKYVSLAARGDRWDVCAEFGVEFAEEGDDEEGGDDEEEEEGDKGDSGDDEEDDEEYDSEIR